MLRELHIVLSKPPAHDSEFVEVEDENGCGMSAGRWEQRGEYWHLILTPYDFVPNVNAATGPVIDALSQLSETARAVWLEGLKDETLRLLDELRAAAEKWAAAMEKDPT
jgi:hypothetical protein